MQPANFLDVFIMRFRDRWETDRQYRAAMSGVIGLVTVIVLCACTGIVSAVTSSALASAGFGGAYSPDGTPVTGVDALHAPPVFPTETVPPWTPGVLPAAPPVPNSQTPIPAPTPTPVPTFVDTTPSPPAGGSLPTTCNGGGPGNSTWALIPCPQRAGQGGTLMISAPGHGGATLNILINFGTCANGANCTYIFTPGQYSLALDGTASISYTVPAEAAHNTTPIGGYINVGGGPTLKINAAPVQ